MVVCAKSRGPTFSSTDLRWNSPNFLATRRSRFRGVLVPSFRFVAAGLHRTLPLRFAGGLFSTSLDVDLELRLE